MPPPDFNAESSLGSSGRTYQGRYQYGSFAQGQAGLPAVVLPTQMSAIEGPTSADETDVLNEDGAVDMEFLGEELDDAEVNIEDEEADLTEELDVEETDIEG